MTGWSRRGLIASAAASLALSRPLDLNAQGRAEGHAQGCCIQPDAQALYHVRIGANRRATRLGQDDILRLLSLESGVSARFERGLGEVLAMAARIFRQRPGFGFYDDGAAPNAYAIDTTAIERTAGTVAFGRTMLRSQLALDGAGVSVAAICAHEFAHILQFKTHWSYRLLRDYPGYCRELHADYLAGYFLRWFEEDRPAISLQGVGRAWEDMGPSEFTDALTHGTAAMRLASIQQGYFDAPRLGADGVEAAAAAGFDYVAEHARRS